MGDTERGRKPSDLSSKVAACNFSPCRRVALGPGQGQPAAGRGAGRGTAGSRPAWAGSASVWHAAGAKPLAGIAFTGLGTAFPTISAATVSSGFPVAAPTPTCVQDDEPESGGGPGRWEALAGEVETRRRGQGQPFSASRRVWHRTSVKSKLGTNNGWTSCFAPSLPF